MYFQWILDYLTSYNLDVLLPLTVVGFLLILPWGVDIWQNIFTVVFAAKGLWLLLFPQHVADIMIKNKADALHLQEIRCVGILLLTDALVHLLLRKSSDPTVKTSLLWVRTVYMATFGMLTYSTVWTAGESKKNNINLKIYENTTPACVLMLGGFLYYSLTQSEWGGYSEPVTMHRDLHIRVDFLIWFVHGLLAFIYPRIACQFQTTLSELDTAHGLLARMMGAGFLSIALLSGRCVNFLREEDKKSVLLSHAFASTFFLLTMSFCQIFTKVFSQWHLYYGMSFVALTAVNALLASDVPNMMKLAKIELRKLVTKTED